MSFGVMDPMGRQTSRMSSISGHGESMLSDISFQQRYDCVPLGMHVVGKRYQVDHKIGSGSFGSVYVGADLESGEQVAVKSEPSCTKQTMLLSEARIYKKLGPRPGFATLRHCGLEAHYNVLVTDLLGPSLGDFHILCGRKFGLKSCLMIGDQVLERLEVLHELGYVHRDLKPQNILMGRGESASLLHVIDFGLTKRFRNPETLQHIAYRENKAPVGTARFASAAASRGCEQGRRDDLEALGYILVYFLCGSLPWQGIQTATMTAKYQKLSQIKSSTSILELCSAIPGQDLFVEYFTYCRGLAFQECPDYSYLRRLFADLLAREGHEYDFAYDWTCPGESLAAKAP